VNIPAGALTPALVEEHIAPLFSLTLRAEGLRGETYLANHSLGRPLDQMCTDVHAALDLWYARMDHSWYDDDGWLAEMNLWRSGTARLVGLPSYDCVVPKVSAGQGLRAVLNALLGQRPINIVSTTGEFDSIDFILKTYASKGAATVKWVEPSRSDHGVPLYDAGDIVSAIDGETDVVVFSRVFYMTAQILAGFHDVVEAAHANGALVVCDLFHAAGVVPLDMQSEGYDFAVGGSYKYLRGGPGACWLAIHPSTFDRGLRSLDTGWFAKADTFEFRRPVEPRFKDRGDGWLESTPSILTPYQARSGLEFALEVGVDRLRPYSLERLALMRETFKSQGIDMYTPEFPDSYGGFTLLPHKHATGLWKSLAEKGVNVDARLGFVRFGPDLLNTEGDFERAASIVKSLM
jgi:kynureninase